MYRTLISVSTFNTCKHFTLPSILVFYLLLKSLIYPFPTTWNCYRRDTLSAIGARQETQLEQLRRDYARLESELTVAHSTLEHRETVHAKQAQECLQINEFLKQASEHIATIQTEAKADKVHCTRLQQRIDNLLAERDIWSLTRESTHDQLANMCVQYDAELERHSVTLRKVAELEREQCELYDRILQLEKVLEEQRTELQHRDEEGSCATELRAQLQQLQHQLDESKRCIDDLRLAAHQASAQRRSETVQAKLEKRKQVEALFTAQAQLVQYGMVLGTLKSKLAATKLVKKILKEELRALRDLGLYEGPISTVAHNTMIKQQEQRRLTPAKMPSNSLFQSSGESEAASSSSRCGAAGGDSGDRRSSGCGGGGGGVGCGGSYGHDGIAEDVSDAAGLNANTSDSCSAESPRLWYLTTRDSDVSDAQRSSLSFEVRLSFDTVYFAAHFDAFNLFYLLL